MAADLPPERPSTESSSFGAVGHAARVALPGLEELKRKVDEIALVEQPVYQLSQEIV